MTLNMKLLGVSSLFGTASVLEAELTLPEISQSVIITRPEGRTPKPASESIASFQSIMQPCASF